MCGGGGGGYQLARGDGHRDCERSGRLCLLHRGRLRAASLKRILLRHVILCSVGSRGGAPYSCVGPLYGTIINDRIEYCIIDRIEYCMHASSA